MSTEIARLVEARIPLLADWPSSGPQTIAEHGIYTVRWGPPEQVQLDFEMLTTDRRTGETHAELAIHLSDPLHGGLLHRCRVNLLSTERRERLAKFLASRTTDLKLDWPAMLEAAVQWTLHAYRQGEPAILLRDAAEPANRGEPLTDPPILAGDGSTIHFGDGGSGKSLIGLALGLALHTGRSDIIEGVRPSAQRRVAFCDWEWSAAVHKRRMARLLPGEDHPDLLYVPCRLPLREERDRLRRIIRDQAIEYLIIDSVALAAGGEPESAEVAIAFFGALREIGVDALLIAHVTKAAASDSSARSPFGSAFWSNSARSTWYVRRQAELGAAKAMQLGLYNRKVNDGPLAAAVGFAVDFGDERIAIRRQDVRDTPDLAAQLPIAVRMTDALRGGAMTLHEIAEEIGAGVEAVRMAAKRGTGKRFTQTVGPDGIYRWGLLQHG